jgi:hypothetical protein
MSSSSSSTMDSSGFSQVGRYGTICLMKRQEPNTVVTAFGIDTEELTFGRDPTCGVRLYYSDVSLVHCRIVFEERKVRSFRCDLFGLLQTTLIRPFLSYLERMGSWWTAARCIPTGHHRIWVHQPPSRSLIIRNSRYTGNGSGLLTHRKNFVQPCSQPQLVRCSFYVPPCYLIPTI